MTPGSTNSIICTNRPLLSAGVSCSGCSGADAAEFGTEFFDWANVLENAPEPSSARKTPIEQRINPRMIRESKKADCGVIFFFISGFFSIALGRTNLRIWRRYQNGLVSVTAFYYKFVMSFL